MRTFREKLQQRVPVVFKKYSIDKEGRITRYAVAEQKQPVGFCG